MIRLARTGMVLLLLASAPVVAQRSPGADKLWSLEQAYWRYVQANDLERYRTLWHPDFLGWPNSSPEPARKAQITGWIAAHSSRGETLKSYDLEPRLAQVTGDIATTTYRIRLTWLGKDGATQSEKVRIIHTWRRSPDGGWQIVSGMSAPTNAEGR